MEDDEFDRLRARLDAALDLHLGPAASSEGLNAEYVMMSLWLPSAGLPAMNAEKERSKLEKIRRLAAELTREWNSLNRNISGQMELDSICNYFQSERGTISSKDKISLITMSFLDEFIEANLAVAFAVIDSSVPAGRRALRNISIVEGLREVWCERKGSEAPRSMSEAGVFADFMFASFDALELTANPRASLDAWRQFRDSHKNKE